VSDNKISTGSFDFNDFLNGGYEKDIITMIAGPPGSGKTNLAILTACSSANKGGKVIFIDTEGGFSVERVKQIIGDNYEKVLEKILILNPTTFDEQRDCFQKLLKNLKKEQIDLIVIDGMAMLYRLELADEDKIKEVNFEVANQMRDLSEISRKQKIPIIITNQVYSQFIKGEYSEEEKIVNIIGGDLFQYWSKCIIELKKNGDSRKAVLLKHRSLPIKEMSFEIRDKGIFKKKLWI